MPSFLLLHYKKHKTSILTLSGIAGSAIGFFWGFDLQKLTPSGILSAVALWKIRMLMTSILASMYFLSLLFLTLLHYKKDIDSFAIIKQDAEEIKNELTNLNAEHNDLRERNSGTESLAIMRGRQLEQCQRELEELKGNHVALQQLQAESERLANGRKFLLETREKELAELKKNLSSNK